MGPASSGVGRTEKSRLVKGFSTAISVPSLKSGPPIVVRAGGFPLLLVGRAGPPDLGFRPTLVHNPKFITAMNAK